MTEPNDFNAKIIDEFRANGGKAGMFPNGNLLEIQAMPAPLAVPGKSVDLAGSPPAQPGDRVRDD